MGYDLRISRAPGFWAQDDSGGITEEEWLALVDEDAELSLEPGRTDLARWRGPSRHPDPWFGWSRGTIVTKNPDPPIVSKMVQIAARLDARVQGDDGEVYLADGKIENDGVIDTRAEMDWRRW